MNDELNNEVKNEEHTSEGIKEWFQDNIRIVVSILIVFLIAFSIYSYSKRGEESIELAESSTSDIEEILEDLSSINTEEADISEVAVTDEVSAEVIAEGDVAITEEVVVEETNTIINKEEVTEKAQEVTKTAKEKANEIANAAKEKANEIAKTAKEKVEVKNIAKAQETENSFIESAQAGDGVTHLARRSLAHYLEKNPDSSLTNEHKIYIEDYMQKKIGFQGTVHIGTTIEFSKSLIQEAINASKNLDASQLKNLQKYSATVQF